MAAGAADCATAPTLLLELALVDAEDDDAAADADAEGDTHAGEKNSATRDRKLGSAFDAVAVAVEAVTDEAGTAAGARCTADGGCVAGRAAALLLAAGLAAADNLAAMPTCGTPGHW